jgi:hypothetical protein
MLSFLPLTHLYVWFIHGWMIVFVPSCDEYLFVFMWLYLCFISRISWYNLCDFIDKPQHFVGYHLCDLNNEFQYLDWYFDNVFLDVVIVVVIYIDCVFIYWRSMFIVYIVYELPPMILHQKNSLIKFYLFLKAFTTAVFSFVFLNAIINSVLSVLDIDLKTTMYSLYCRQWYIRYISLLYSLYFYDSIWIEKLL